jgi:hypothetical protein
MIENIRIYSVDRMSMHTILSLTNIVIVFVVNMLEKCQNIERHHDEMVLVSIDK